MNRFERVMQLLEDAVNGEVIGAHGAFWRGATRNEFVSKSIFGFQLLSVGDGNSSNLVKALRGQSPFGADLPAPPPGAIFSRMPAGRPPVAIGDIEFIRQWIDDGCLEDDVASVAVFDANAGGVVEPLLHNALWFEFDNWAMFHATPDVIAAIGQFFPVAAHWRTFAADPSQVWQSAIQQDSVRQAIEFLAERQFLTFRDHFGLPIPLGTFLDAFERFGDNSLPDDPLRSQDRRHNMNGRGMWFVWSAFCDACLRLGIRPEFWSGMCRGLLISMLNDGLFRGRFNVVGFTADMAGKEAVRHAVRGIADADLQAELARRFVESGVG